MSRHQIAWNGATKTATIQAFGAALPANTTNAGNFYHDDVHGDGDKQGDQVGHHGTHAMYHHVRDVLYKNGVLDMQAVKILSAA